MRYYQGDEIDFSIDIKQFAAGDMEDWTSFPFLYVYFYTHPSFIAKFDKYGKEGYTRLTLSDDMKTYSGEITHEQTLQMKGALRMDVRVVDESANISTRSIDTGIRILETPLKHEKGA
jgi:hypothetical protein